MITLTQTVFDRIIEHAKTTAPDECCGLIASKDRHAATTIYQLTNVSPTSSVAYEAGPEQLFAAQRQMRDLGENLFGIYHSHPRSNNPVPSETDVRLAYYPEAVYFIVGLAGESPVMRAFRIFEREERWEQVEYEIVGE